MPPAVPPPPPWYRRRYFRLPAWAWLALLGLAVFGALLPKPTPPPKVERAPRQAAQREEPPIPELPPLRPPDATVTAWQLRRAYAQGAGAPYTGKLLRVTGQVLVAKTSTWGADKGTFYVNFTAPPGQREPWTISALFLHPSHAPAIAAGQLLTVQGTCRGQRSRHNHISLEGCRVVEDESAP